MVQQLPANSTFLKTCYPAIGVLSLDFSPRGGPHRQVNVSATKRVEKGMRRLRGTPNAYRREATADGRTTVPFFRRSSLPVASTYNVYGSRSRFPGQVMVPDC